MGQRPRFHQALPDGTSEWYIYGMDEPVTMTPAEVMQQGLTDLMREGVTEQIRKREAGEYDDTVPGIFEQLADVRPATAPVDRKLRDLQVLGGHTDVWRWQAVDDGEGGVVWAIDNRPALDAWRQAGEFSGCPEYQHLTLPDDVLRAIVAAT